MKRQPRGVPVGGQFAADARDEADVAIATDDEAIAGLAGSSFQTPVTGTVDDPEWSTFAEAIPGSSMESWFDPEANETGADVSVPVESMHIMGLSDLGDDLSDEDERKVERGTVVLDQLLRERYTGGHDGVEIDYSADEPSMRWRYLEEGLQSQETMHTKAWDDPKGPVLFTNESDPGTFGHESLPRVFADRIRDTASVAAPTLYDSSRSLDQTELDERKEFEATRAFDQDRAVPPPTDNNVRGYAKNMAQRMEAAGIDSAELSRLHRQGYCSASKIEKELDELEKIPAFGRDRVFRDFDVQQIRSWATLSNRRIEKEWDQA